MTVSTARILTVAADIVEKQGLAKGEYFKLPGFSMDGEYFRDPRDVAEDFKLAGDEPKCCALGAIYMAAAVTEAQGEDLHSAMERLATSLDLNSTADIPDWNDAKNRRKKQVVDALRRAADWSKW